MQDILLPFCHLHAGVAQSSIIALYLLNHHVSDYLQLASFISIYYNDITAASSSFDYRKALTILIEHAPDVSEYGRNPCLSSS